MPIKLEIQAKANFHSRGCCNHVTNASAPMGARNNESAFGNGNGPVARRPAEIDTFQGDGMPLPVTNWMTAQSARMCVTANNERLR